MLPCGYGGISASITRMRCDVMLAATRLVILCVLVQSATGLASTIPPEMQMASPVDPGVRVVHVSETSTAPPAEVGISRTSLIADEPTGVSVAPETTTLATYHGVDSLPVTTHVTGSKRPATRPATSEHYEPFPSSVAGVASAGGPVARYAPEMIALSLLVAVVVYVERRSRRDVTSKEPR